MEAHATEGGLSPKTEIEPQWERSGHGRTLHPQIEANDTDGHGL